MDTPNFYVQPTTFNQVVMGNTLQSGTQYNKKLMYHLLDDLVKVSYHEGIFLDLGRDWGHLTKLAKEIRYNDLLLEREDTSKIDGLLCSDIDNERFPLASNSVSVVFCKSAFEHLYVHQLPPFMSEVQRVLKLRGSIIFMIPNWDSNIHNFHTILSDVTPYTNKSLAQCMKMYCFANIRIRKLIQLLSTWNNRGILLLSKLFKYSPLSRGVDKWVFRSKQFSLAGIASKPE